MGSSRVHGGAMAGLLELQRGKGLRLKLGEVSVEQLKQLVSPCHVTVNRYGGGGTSLKTEGESLMSVSSSSKREQQGTIRQTRAKRIANRISTLLASKRRRQ